MQGTEKTLLGLPQELLDQIMLQAQPQQLDVTFHSQETMHEGGRTTNDWKVSCSNVSDLVASSRTLGINRQLRQTALQQQRLHPASFLVDFSTPGLNEADPQDENLSVVREIPQWAYDECRQIEIRMPVGFAPRDWVAGIDDGTYETEKALIGLLTLEIRRMEQIPAGGLSQWRVQNANFLPVQFPKEHDRHHGLNCLLKGVNALIADINSHITQLFPVGRLLALDLYVFKDKYFSDDGRKLLPRLAPNYTEEELSNWIASPWQQIYAWEAKSHYQAVVHERLVTAEAWMYDKENEEWYERGNQLGLPEDSDEWVRRRSLDDEMEIDEDLSFKIPRRSHSFAG